MVTVAYDKGEELHLLDVDDSGEFEVAEPVIIPVGSAGRDDALEAAGYQKAGSWESRSDFPDGDGEGVEVQLD